MDTISNNGKPLAQQGKEAVNKAADSVQDGIRSTQRSASQALDKVADKADDMRSTAAPMLDKVGDQAQKLVQQGREVLQDTTKTVREKANQASDMAVAYTKDEPIKALLIAAASGALLMGLVSMMARSRD